MVLGEGGNHSSLGVGPLVGFNALMDSPIPMHRWTIGVEFDEGL